MTAEVLDPPRNFENSATQQLAPYQAQKPGKAPTLILMAGFAGAGKTTLAKSLSRRLRLEILNKDELKLKRLAKGEEEEQAGWNAFEELMQQIEEKVIKQKESVIIDTSNEKPFIYENVQQLVEQLRGMQINAQLQIILCKLSKEIRIERLNKRGSVFAPYIQTLPEVLDDTELSDRFKHLPADKIVVVDTRAPLKTYKRKVLKCLNTSNEEV